MTDIKINGKTVNPGDSVTVTMKAAEKIEVTATATDWSSWTISAEDGFTTEAKQLSNSNKTITINVVAPSNLAADADVTLTAHSEV